MSARKTVVHVEKLSRTEYNVTKNIPEAMPKKNFTLEKNKFPKKTPPTPFPSDLFNFISPNLQPETRYDSPQKNQQISNEMNKRKSLSARGHSQNNERNDGSERLKEKEEENILLQKSVSDLNLAVGMLRTELEERGKKSNNNDTELKLRINELEEQKRVDSLAIQNEKKFTSELKTLLQEKENEISEKTEFYNEETRRAREQVSVWREKAKRKDEEIQRIREEYEEEFEKIQEEGGKLREEERNSLEIQAEKYKINIQELENSVERLRNELKIAKENNANQETMVEDWKKKYRQLESLKSESLDLSTQKLKKREQEINEMKITFAEEERNYQSQIHQLESKTLEIENKFVLLCQENEQLNLQNKKLQDEYRNKEKINIDIKQRTSYLENQNKEQIASIESLKAKRQSIEDHCRSLERELENLNPQVDAKDSEIHFLQNEIEKLTENYELSLKEKLDNQLNTFKQEISQEKMYWEARLAEISIQRDDYKLKYSQLLTEIEKANEASLDIVAENKSLREQVEHFSKEIFENKQNNNLIIQQSELAFQDTHRKLLLDKAEAEDEVLHVTAKVQHHEIQLVLFMIELERLQQIIEEKENVANLWRDQIVEIESSYKSHTETMNNKISEMEYLIVI